MNVYKVGFKVTGEATLNGESMTSVVDRLMERFRDGGANQLLVKVIEINGERTNQERKETDK